MRTLLQPSHILRGMLASPLLQSQQPQDAHAEVLPSLLLA